MLNLAIIFWCFFDFIVLCIASCTVIIHGISYVYERVTGLYLIYAIFSTLVCLPPRILILMDNAIGAHLFPLCYGALPVVVSMTTRSGSDGKKRSPVVIIGVLWLVIVGVLTPFDYIYFVDMFVWSTRWLFLMFWMLYKAVSIMIESMDKGKALEASNECFLLVSLSLLIWTINYSSRVPDSTIGKLEIFWVIASIIQTICYDHIAYSLYMRQQVDAVVTENSQLSGNVHEPIRARKPKERTLRHIANLVLKRGMPNGCSICWEEFNVSNDENIKLGFFKKCGHPFHVACIEDWLKVASACPVCRAESSPNGLIQISYQQLDRALLPCMKPPTDVDRQSKAYGDMSCSVCESKFQGNPREIIVAYLPNCHHCFHTSCVYTEKDNVCHINKCPSCNVPSDKTGTNLEIKQAFLSDILDSNVNPRTLIARL